ncbi:hypothetical protein NHX12_026268 [Muraenolepis orangiensis]|uniref:Uncharacterized protein n=1 Tax=Muraenolepis orangiensis TaxID=630683 RepID=A0A9Q0EH24_9TELE|nr:hypothetical protein NHX12_026268 [Muraenolepis orangiensis]
MLSTRVTDKNIDLFDMKRGAYGDKGSVCGILLQSSVDTSVPEYIPVKNFKVGLNRGRVSEKEEAGELLQQETIAIFVIRDAQAAPKDIGIILEGQEVVNTLASVANAVAILLVFLYALTLEYPKTLKFTFQYIQKVFMELDPKGMPTKVKKLYDQLYNTAGQEAL